MSELTHIKLIKFPFVTIEGFLGFVEVHKLRSISFHSIDNYSNELNLKQTESVREIELDFSRETKIDYVKLKAFSCSFSRLHEASDSLLLHR